MRYLAPRNLKDLNANRQKTRGGLVARGRLEIFAAIDDITPPPHQELAPPANTEQFTCGLRDGSG